MTAPASTAYTIYSDGSFRRLHTGTINGFGAWAAIVLRGTERIAAISGPVWHTTNNRMEVMAIIRALEAVPGAGATITLYSDSTYAVESVNRWVDGWARRGWILSTGLPVRNRDLMEELYALKKRHAVTARWVRGHSGDPLNEEVDQMAQALTEKMAKGTLKPPAD